MSTNRYSKLAKDLLPGDVVLNGTTPRRVLHCQPSRRSGLTRVLVRTETGCEYHEKWLLTEHVTVMP